MKTFILAPSRTPRACAVVLAMLLAGAASFAEPLIAPGADAIESPHAPAARSVLELQSFRQSTRGRMTGGGDDTGAVLTDLNPVMHAWYVLEVPTSDGRRVAYHLELPDPDKQRLLLDSADGSSVLITSPDGDRHCVLQGDNSLAAAAMRKLPYVPLCDGALYLRRRLRGAETSLESVVEFLRDRVWGGEQLVDAVKARLSDAEREVGTIATRGEAPSAVDGGPRPARVAERFADAAIASERLGIAVDAPGSMLAGRWYAARAQQGVYVSVMEGDAVAPAILESNFGSVNPLDAVERSALVYLVAFDLAQFDMAFTMGTDHPRVDWSPRAFASHATSDWAGPDGFATLSPLAMTGMVPPWQTARTIATFIGGFKRDHGAFKYGAFSRSDNGNHYGFVEQGVVLSSLKPGLATLYVLVDGSVHMGTWTERDARKLELVRYARQNGVALVERDHDSGESVPGLLVNRWGPGNWSGSSESSLRALRSGLCMARHNGRDMLIYAYFSTATPSLMARVFQAYDCDYAMLLDMNALVHTYLALYRQQGSEVAVEHVVRDMIQGDPVLHGEPLPRFLATPDNRDFFYLTRRVTPRAR
ncbi:MAG: hypothetical protein IPG43_18720 [Proteobacteria bacterium]|nr:hypothetical protein [Pseudomonadota bacterium]